MQLKLNFLAVLTLGVAAAAALAACSGDVAPGSEVTCSTAGAISYTGPGGSSSPAHLVVQTFLIDDKAQASQVPMVKTNYAVTSDSAYAKLCAGTGCTADQTSIDVKTDANGIGQFSVVVSAPTSTGGTFSGNLLETFGGSASTCQVSYTVTNG